MDCIHILIPFTKTTSNLAVASRLIHRWLKNNGFPIQTCDADLCIQNLSFLRSLPGANISHIAAKNGRIDCLEALRLENHSFDSELFEYAAMNGQLKVLKWIHNTQPIDFDINLIVYSAALKGYLDILKWLHSHNYRIPFVTLTYPTSEGHLEIVRWFVEEKIITDHATKYICRHIALHKGYTEIAKLLEPKLI